MPMSNNLTVDASRWKANAAGELLAYATALCAILGGCATHEPNRIALESPLEGVRSMFIVARSYHAGLAVRTRDVPADAWPAQRDFPNARTRPRPHSRKPGAHSQGRPHIASTPAIAHGAGIAPTTTAL